MNHLNKELEFGYISKMLSVYDKVEEKYGNMIIGGSTALILYGLIPYREIGDLDLIYTGNFEGVNLNKDRYYNVPFEYRATPGGFEVSIDNKSWLMNIGSLEELKKTIQTTVFNSNPILPSIVEHEDYDDNLHEVFGVTKVDFFKETNMSITYKCNFLGRTIDIQDPNTILDARLTYGVDHTHIVETCEAILKLQDWENPFEASDLPF